MFVSYSFSELSSKKDPSLLTNPAIVGSFWNLPAFRRFLGESGKKCLSTTGWKFPLVANCRISDAFFDRRHLNIWSVFLRPQFNFSARFVEDQETTELSLKAKGDKSVPLSEIMPWTRPLESGDRIWRFTLAPPALSPNSVTRVGSPPKLSIFSLIHLNASTWSNIP